MAIGSEVQGQRGSLCQSAYQRSCFVDLCGTQSPDCDWFRPTLRERLSDRLPTFVGSCGRKKSLLVIYLYITLNSNCVCRKERCRPIDRWLFEIQKRKGASVTTRQFFLRSIVRTNSAFLIHPKTSACKHTFCFDCCRSLLFPFRQKVWLFSIRCPFFSYSKRAAGGL